MKTSRIMTLVVAAAVLAVVASSNAYAATWNGMTDTTQYQGYSQAYWYSWIDFTGSASIGSKVSWSNALNNQVYGSTVRPVVEWKDDINADGTYSTFTNVDSNTIGYNTAWSVIQYSQSNVNSNSAPDIYVDHDYRDINGDTLSSSGYKMHYYNKV